MKRISALIAASLLATATAMAPAFAQGKSGDAPGHSGDGPGNSASAPGHNKSNGGGGGSDSAPGLLKFGDGLFGFGKSERAAKANKFDTQTTAAVQGKSNFGTLISSIRAGKSSLDGVAFDSTINVIHVEDLIQGSNRVALDNALADNDADIEALRDDLAALDPDGLNDEEIDRVVAARPEADGSLTVYLD